MGCWVVEAVPVVELLMAADATTFASWRDIAG